MYIFRENFLADTARCWRLLAATAIPVICRVPLQKSGNFFGGHRYRFTPGLE
jgi:hypothetical protein